MSVRALFDAPLTRAQDFHVRSPPLTQDGDGMCPRRSLQAKTLPGRRVANWNGYTVCMVPG